MSCSSLSVIITAAIFILRLIVLALINTPVTILSLPIRSETFIHHSAFFVVFFWFSLVVLTIVTLNLPKCAEPRYGMTSSEFSPSSRLTSTLSAE